MYLKSTVENYWSDEESVKSQQRRVERLVMSWRLTLTRLGLDSGEQEPVIRRMGCAAHINVWPPGADGVASDVPFHRAAAGVEVHP